MSAGPHRRGLLRGLIAALFGWSAARAGTAEARPEAPPRCPHYYDGTLWCERRPGQTGHYLRDTEGCPICYGRELARKLSGTQGPASPHSTTRVYDASRPLTSDPSTVTTMVYDTSGRNVADHSSGTFSVYEYPPRQPPV